MFNTLYLLNYNNYYNRLVKKEDSVSDYQPYIIAEIQTMNFTPGDNISASAVCNFSDDLAPDYVLITDDFDNIVSRWFVIEQSRTRGNQWELLLKRDVIADYYNIIMDSPAYVEKGYIDGGNPLIYNSENVNLNQIKKKEFLLKNELKTPWLVAYLSRLDGEGNYNTFKGEFIDDSDITPDYVLDTLSEYKYYKYRNAANAYIYTDDVKFCMVYNDYDAYYEDASTAPDKTYGLSKTGYYYATANADAYSSQLPLYRGTDKPAFESDILRAIAYETLFDQYAETKTVDSTTGLTINAYTNIGTFEDYQILSKEANKVIQVGQAPNATYYRIQTNIKQQYNFTNSFPLANSVGSFGRTVMETLQGTGNWAIPSQATYQTPFILIPYENPGIYITLSEINPDKKVQYNFTYNSNITYQTPYEIIAAPLHDINFTTTAQTIAHSGEIALSWFMDLAQKGSLVHDVQILPYSPVTSTDISKYSWVKCYYETAVNTPLAIAVKLPISSFSAIYAVPDDLPIDSDYKRSVNCDLYRICSPNGIGNFDFSPAKNNGLLGFEVDCTMIPFNPYIKINPIFNTSGLYGGDYNDFRGLICGGDFSLPIVSSAWEQYQLENKNYQAMFDRENQTIEVQQQWERVGAWTSGLSKTAGGIGAGLASGGVAGAIVGGATAVTKSALDIAQTYKLQAETLSSRKDLFELNLGSIKARPMSLARTTAYNINNKYFPYIEYYSCSDEEKALFDLKIKYEGMTVNAIGNVKDFLGPDETFFKGRIIRFQDGLDEDFHMAQVISAELMEGVYIRRETT